MTKRADFEQFMTSYQNMVFSTAYRFLGNETDAADIAQEVFLKAYERFDDLAHNERAGGWLKTVTTNLCLNQLTRYRARWRFFTDLSREDSDEDFAANLPAPDTNDSPLDDHERRRVLEAALQKLPAAQRVPLVLYHYEDLSYEEIARQLGVSLAKVKTDIHRGRETLRRRLEGKREDQLALPRAVLRPAKPETGGFGHLKLI